MFTLCLRSHTSPYLSLLHLFRLLGLHPTPTNRFAFATMHGLHPPHAESPSSVSTANKGITAKAADHSGWAWTKAVDDDNCWDDLILTLGTYSQVSRALCCDAVALEWCQRTSYHVHRTVYLVHTTTRPAIPSHRTRKCSGGNTRDRPWWALANRMRNPHDEEGTTC